jgi:2-polyprenyl-3-methyl-5-hydroxy-6-metoxy-1,4-benzoquinol methylase
LAGENLKSVDAHYANPRLAEIYDAGNGWSEDRDFYLNLAGSTPIRVLDLGCGTGLICHAYASKGHMVTGVDPAASMLDVARRKKNGSKIEWILAEAQEYSSDRLFDLIIMTGHAFQVLLSDKDVQSTFRTMRKHLAKGGKIVFESRNPQIDWVSRWNKNVNLELPQGKVFIERKVKGRHEPFITFETRYHFSDETLVSESKLRFWTQDEIASLLESCDLQIVDFFGDWDKTAFEPRISEEMIFIIKNVS